MAYTRTTWVSEETPISADNMNNIEDGIEEIKNTVGTIYNSNVDTTFSVSSNGYKTITSLTLPAGVYVVTGHVQCTTIPNSRFAVGVSTSQTPGMKLDGVQTHYSSTQYNANLSLQTTAIINSSNSITVYLSAYSQASTAVTVNSGILRAVRIK